MNRTHPVLSHPRNLACTATLALALAGCGAGADVDGNTVQAVAPGEGVAYAETLAYCGARAPSGTAAQPGGLEITTPTRDGAPSFDVSAVVSPAGAPDSFLPMRLQVAVHDYRSVVGPILLSGYAEQLAKMGVDFVPTLPAKSAACIAGLAKLTPATAPRYTLAWGSKWAASVSFDAPNVGIAE